MRKPPFSRTRHRVTMGEAIPWDTVEIILTEYDRVCEELTSVQAVLNDALEERGFAPLLKRIAELEKKNQQLEEWIENQEDWRDRNATFLRELREGP